MVGPASMAGPQHAFHSMCGFQASKGSAAAAFTPLHQQAGDNQQLLAVFLIILGGAWPSNIAACLRPYAHLCAEALVDQALSATIHAFSRCLPTNSRLTAWTAVLT